MSTIKDVARLAGVSPSTVSRVVNGGDTSSASPKTVERIWKAVRETGYSVNESARKLRKPVMEETIERQGIDCIFARDIDSFVDPFFTELMHIIETEVFKQGYRIHYQYTVSDLRSHTRQDSDKKNAAIVLGRVEEESLKRLKNNYRQMVYIGLQDKPLNIDSVICPAYDAVTAGMEYLLSLGHKRICYLGETRNEQRYDAYVDMMERMGLDKTVVDVRFTPSDSYEKLKKALEGGMNCTAIFCANDMSAVGVLRALREKRLSVPKDISLMGLNDLESVRYLDPMLTTVRIPLEEMGKHAAMLLIDRIEGGHRLPVKLTLPSEIVVRNSCAAAHKRRKK